MTNPVHSNVLVQDFKAGDKIRTGRVLGLVLAVLVVLACGTLPSPAQPAPADTVPAPPSLTPEPTIAPTSTAAPPTLLVSVALPCYLGPGEEYELMADLEAGEEVELVGQSEGFWVVKTTNTGTVCWVPDQGVIPQGEVAALPNVEPPPIPTPAAPAAPANLEAFGNVCYIDKSYTPNKRVNRFHLYWQDMADNEDGFQVYRDGTLVAELPPDKNEVIDQIVAQNDRVHTYYVVAYNAVGESKSDVIGVACSSGSGGGGGGYP